MLGQPVPTLWVSNVNRPVLLPVIQRINLKMASLLAYTEAFQLYNLQVCTSADNDAEISIMLFR